MGKVKNWDRRKDLERDDQPFVWQNTVTDEVLYVREHPSNPEWYSLERQDNMDKFRDHHYYPVTEEEFAAKRKDDARKEAVDWMEDNPRSEPEYPEGTRIMFADGGYMEIRSREIDEDGEAWFDVVAFDERDNQEYTEHLHKEDVQHIAQNPGNEISPP